MVEAILDWFERRSTRAKVWSLVAEQKRGQYEPPRGGLFRRTKPIIDAEIGGVMVRVTLRVESSGDRQDTYTIVSAPWLLGYGPRVKVARAGVFQKVGRALGMQDVPTGDAQFDAEFVVKSPLPDLVPMVLGARARRSLRALTQTRMESDEAHARLTHFGVITDAARLSVSMDACAEIASHGSAHVRVLSELPGRFVPPHGPWTSRVPPYTDLEVGRTQVRARVVTYPFGVYYDLRAPLQRELPELAFSFVGGVPDPTPTEGVFDPETFATLVSFGNLTLRTRRGEACLELSSALDGEALIRAARWLSTFVEPSRRGAFR